MEEEKRCQEWLPKKRRYCANLPLPPSLYCGNHTTRSHANWLPCPIDPSQSVFYSFSLSFPLSFLIYYFIDLIACTKLIARVCLCVGFHHPKSQSRVLDHNMESHIKKKKCPLLKQAHSLSLLPYYLKGINSGTPHPNPNPNPNHFTSSEMKRTLVYTFTLSQFSAFFSKIRAIHASLCSDISFSYILPQASHLWLTAQFDGKLPYKEKHVLQQASIVGNLEALGVFTPSRHLLPNHDTNHNPVSAVVEFGAGRGYLTQLLADSYGINKVFLVERKSYKLKADRSLRQKDHLTLERLRIDIEDLNLNAVQSLRGMPYLAIGKHLCGPATDLTLRCCLADLYDQDNGTDKNVCQDLRGIALATCCHHLCQWKHYINRKYLLKLGITEEDFHALTWFTSWAVDADHGPDLSDDEFLKSPLPPGDQPLVDAKGVEDLFRNMKPSERAMLGYMCKDIIDMGRFLWVKDCGLESKLVKYVPSDISPENRLIVARA